VRHARRLSGRADVDFFHRRSTKLDRSEGVLDNDVGCAANTATPTPSQVHGTGDGQRPGGMGTRRIATRTLATEMRDSDERFPPDGTRGNVSKFACAERRLSRLLQRKFLSWRSPPDDIFPIGCVGSAQW
jgi:hypothetical protein